MRGKADIQRNRCQDITRFRTWDGKVTVNPQAVEHDHCKIRRRRDTSACHNRCRCRMRSKLGELNFGKDQDHGKEHYFEE